MVTKNGHEVHEVRSRREKNCLLPTVVARPAFVAFVSVVVTLVFVVLLEWGTRAQGQPSVRLTDVTRAAAQQWRLRPQVPA
jgi:hypothetical protein